MTFLVTSKMSPELAARVEASVTGKKPSASKRGRLFVKSLIRVGLVVGIGGTVTMIVRAELTERREREQARATLMALVESEQASVTEEDRKSVDQVDGLLRRLAQTQNEPDYVAKELKSAEGLSALLARTAVYVRGPLVQFTSPEGVGDAAHESAKDALVACLFDPPASRQEKVVLQKARPTAAGLEALTPHISRVADARDGLPFLIPQFKETVAKAHDIKEIESLSARFKKAPLARAKQALRAELLMVAMDDTASGTGPTELDGARAHDVRFTIVEVHSTNLLVRLRKHVDPSWVSLPQRAQNANKLDSCVLAMDIRESIVK